MAEPLQQCCGCVDISGGACCLIFIEICYLIYFVFVVVVVGFLALLASDLDTPITSDSSTACEGLAKSSLGKSQSLPSCKKSEAAITSTLTKQNTLVTSERDFGLALFHIAVGMLVAYLFRLYYLCKLCGWVCCGKSSDTSKDR